MIKLQTNRKEPTHQEDLQNLESHLQNLIC